MSKIEKPYVREFMNFICPEGMEFVKVTIPSGNTCIVGSEPTKIEKQFWTKAIELHCSPEGVRLHTPAVTPKSDPIDELADDLRRMIQQMGDKAMNTAGLPDLAKFRKFSGSNITMQKLAAAWTRMQELDGEESDEKTTLED